MTPELQILTINAVCMAVGYLGLYPGAAQRGLMALAMTDLVVSLIALLTAAVLFMGSGVAFSLILFEVNWFGFSLITLILMEAVLFPWFARRHGVWPGDDE